MSHLAIIMMSPTNNTCLTHTPSPSTRSATPYLNFIHRIGSPGAVGGPGGAGLRPLGIHLANSSTGVHVVLGFLTGVPGLLERCEPGLLPPLELIGE
jgi:hypothetical protein